MQTKPGHVLTLMDTCQYERTREKDSCGFPVSEGFPPESEMTHQYTRVSHLRSQIPRSQSASGFRQKQSPTVMAKVSNEMMPNAQTNSTK